MFGIKLEEIVIKIPGFFKIYLFLRNFLYKKKVPKNFNSILFTSINQNISNNPSITFQSDQSGMRIEFGSKLPYSVLSSRSSPSKSSDKMISTINPDYINLNFGNQSIDIRLFEHSEWSRIEIDHQFIFAFGLAEKNGSLNKNGKEFKIWNTDIANFEIESDPLYKNYPLLMLGKNDLWISLIIDYPGYQKWDLRDQEKITISLQTANYIFDLLVADSPKELMKKISTTLGTMDLPPRWSLGYHQCRWSYFPASEVRRIAKEFRKRDLPIDAIYLDIDYMDGFRSFTYDSENFGDLPKLVKELHNDNFKVIAMIDPGLKKDENFDIFNQGVEGDHFTKRSSGALYVDPVWAGDSVFPNFFNSKTQDWWGQLYDNFVNNIGIDGWWNDMNEPSIFTIRGTMPDHLLHKSDDGIEISHGKIHNLYGQKMAEASYNGLKRLQGGKRVFLLSRSAYLGSQKYGFIWSGDNKSAWSHLKMSISKIIGTGLVGHFANGPDIGGFRNEATPELYARWIQLGVFYPFMRTHSIKFSPHQEPWTFGPEVETIANSMIRLRYRLAPYIYTHFREGCESGTPLMRPMWMEFPNDDQCYNEEVFDNQFMFGPNLLVAPIVEKGMTKKQIYLPPGVWHHFFTDETYSGPKIVTIDAPLAVINVFVRNNSIIPVYNTVSINMEITASSGIEFITFGEDASGFLYLDDGSTFAYQNNQYDFTK